MNRREHLLTILGEECSELHQEICKILRFGYDHEKWVRLQGEYNDLLAMIQMVADEGIVVHKHDHLIQEKKDKVERYLLESEKLGTLEDYHG